jgi:hypothetical protein
MIGQFGISWESRNQSGYRYRVYREIGDWLYKNTPKNALIGTLETGTIGYFAKRPIVDFAGLLQPEVAYQLRSDTGYNDAAKWVVNHYHPDYLIFQAGVYTELIENYIGQYCSMIMRFSGDDHDAPEAFELYQCKYQPIQAP